MEAKSSVVKSRSSNSAKTLKSEHRNKKSRSNAEFPPYVMKKRGVYVEPAKVRLSELEKNQGHERPKAPPRPKPGNKKFLASVLTILSKSTTGTQYPDVNDPPNRRTEKRVRRKTNEKQDIKENGTKADTDERGNTDVEKKAKRKYRSKALNNSVNKQDDQFVVLQTRKDVIQTPSIYSENDSFNWSNLSALVKRAQQENEEAVQKRTKEVASELAKEIMEGRKPRKDRRVRIDEPKTLIADITQKPDEVAQANGKLYNFFVDLLETTISVYNVKEENYKPLAAPSEASSTKVPLEINESVANKLNKPREQPTRTEPTCQQSNHFMCLKDLEFCNRCPQFEPNDAPLRAKRKKYKAESFSFMRKPAPRKIKTASVIETKKSFSRKGKKKDLLNLFKEQLRMDAEYEEPQNLYQALKVIAQNKRRCQKTIHFEELAKKRHRDYGFPECMFKRRKVISPSTKGSKRNNTPSLSGRMSEMSGYNRSRSEYNTDVDDHDSYHSLEVYGYDYEAPASRKTERARSDFQPRDLVFTYHSTPTHSERTIGSRDVLDFSETDSMYFF